MTTVQEDPERLFVPHPGQETLSQSVSQSTLATTTTRHQSTTLCPPSPAGGGGSDTAGAAAAAAATTHSNLSHHSRHTSARSVSHRSSVASTARRSISTIHSHVSDFQNVRFDPDPAKDISLWGGIALLISNMTGPGLITVPIIAQQAGWLPTVAVFALVGLLSSLSSLFICEAMTEVPGNEYFQSNVEFSNLVLCFFGKRYHVVVQVVFLLAMQTTNIASIAVSAQLFDNLLIKIFHQTCGIRLAPHAGFVCVKEQLSSASPFSGVMIMSTGVILALAMILPLAFLKLSENIWIQLASFTLVIFVVLQWIITFFIHGLDTSLVPVVGSDVSQIFGTVLFNYAFITTVPSWANAKKPSVSIHKTIGYSTSITTTMYILVAILGGMAFHIPTDSTLIQAINSSPQVSVLSQITGYTFPIAALITSIPINIIVIRYNLIQSGVCNMFWANVLSAVAPWLFAVPCMTGAGLTTVINWSSLFLLSMANFIIPFVLYIYSKKHKDKLRKLPIIELEQHARLSREVSRSSFSGFSRRPGSMVDSLRQRHNQSFSDLNAMSVTIEPGGSTAPPSPGYRGTGHHPGHSSEDYQHLSSFSDTSFWTGGHRRLGTNQTGHGQWPSLETPTMSGPYFSFARDGEVHERDGSGASSHPPATSIRPSGASTVILHDPITEMAQRKANLPRRVSRKDRILSLISEKHKRALELQQEKERMQEQSEKPVPPMILLSQSITDCPHDGMNEKDGQAESQHTRSNYSASMTNISSSATHPNYCYQQQHTRANSIGAPTTLFESSTVDLSAGKQLNRKSSIISTTLNKFSKGLVPSSPPASHMTHDTTFGDYRGSTSDEALHNQDPRTRSVEHPSKESPTSPSPLYSTSHSPVSPKKSALKKSPTPTRTPSPSLPPGHDNDTITPRPSLSLSAQAGGEMYRRDATYSPFTSMDNSRLSPSGPSTSLNPSPRPVAVPSTPDSASTSPLSPRSPDRRVSFSDDRSQPNPFVATTLSPPLALPTPAVQLERKPSFSSETKKAVRAAFQGLTGGSPKPFSSSSSSSAAATREGVQKLLRREDSDSRESTTSTSSSRSLDDEHDLGPELDVARMGEGFRPSSYGTHHPNITTPGWVMQGPVQPHSVPKGIAAAVASQGRRDSLGRMAAAFSSQPGSFAIKTTRQGAEQSRLQLPEGSKETQGPLSGSLPFPAASLSPVSRPMPPLSAPVRSESPRALESTPQPVFTTLSPSSPPLLSIPPVAMVGTGDFIPRMSSMEQQYVPEQPQTRNHMRSISASVVDSTVHVNRNSEGRSTSGCAAAGATAVSRAVSTQSLKDLDRFSPSTTHPTLLAVSTATTPTMHLTPPSPLLDQDISQFKPSSATTPPHTPTPPPSVESSLPCTPTPPAPAPLAPSHSHSRSLSIAPWVGAGFGGGGGWAHRRQSSHQPSHSSRTTRSSPMASPNRIIAPPFLGGHNYSIPGFGSNSNSSSGGNSNHSRSPTSEHFSTMNGAGVGACGGGIGGHAEEESSHYGIGGRRRFGHHTREHSRSTMISAYNNGDTLYPPGRPPLSSPPPGIVPGHDAILPDGGMASSTGAAITTAAAVASAVAGLGGGGGGGGGGRGGHDGQPSVPESQWTLPQHHHQTLAEFDALWSLKAIPDWVPMSSLTIAWSSLGVLLFGIGATVIYDFVQLGLGKNPVGNQ